MNTRVMIVDDEDLFREDLATLLRQEGYECSTAADSDEAIRLVERERPDVVLCDLMLPGTSGLDTLKRIRDLASETHVLMLTAHGAIDSAVAAFHLGAVDYVLKPVVPEDLLQKIARCAEFGRLQQELIQLRREMAEVATGTTIIGDSPAIQGLKQMIARLGTSRTHVLITGESGTGKELVARSLHEVCCGPKQPFIAVNCAAVPRDLLESELFGYVRGAFTGATRDKPGFFELADNGTLFLDEICDMPFDLQPKLLRAIEQQEIVRLGAIRSIAVDARIVAATNCDVRRAVDERQFREDLYFRLSVVTMHIPPLRDRREDIPQIVNHLLHRLNWKLKRNIAGVDRDAMRTLMSASWRGNVRELENVLERAILLCDESVIGLAQLPPQLLGDAPVRLASDDLRDGVRAYERAHIRQVLEATRGNREEAARRLGVDASTLYRRIKELAI